MDYVSTYPNPILRFYASDMVLTSKSDAAYLVLPKARSRAAGFFYLHNHPKFKPHSLLMEQYLLNVLLYAMLFLLQLKQKWVHYIIMPE